MKPPGACRVAEAFSQLGAVPKNAFSTWDVEQVRAMKLRSLPSLVPTVASSAWTSQQPLAMAKGGHENAVIGNLDDPLALDTRLEQVGATGASSFASVLDASPLNVVMVVDRKGIENGHTWLCIFDGSQSRSLDISHCDYSVRGNRKTEGY